MYDVIVQIASAVTPSTDTNNAKQRIREITFFIIVYLQIVLFFLALYIGGYISPLETDPFLYSFFAFSASDYICRNKWGKRDIFIEV